MAIGRENSKTPSESERKWKRRHGDDEDLEHGVFSFHGVALEFGGAEFVGERFRDHRIEEKE